MALFCDASALVKYYVSEPGSTWVREVLDARPAVFLSEITSLVSVALDSIYHAAHLCMRHPLKAYDAVQLATALSVRETLAEHDIPLTFVSGDSTLVAAATTEGVVVDNPFLHTDLDQ